MRATDGEPTPQELELLLDDEERARIADPLVPDDEKSEIEARLEARREIEVESAVPDEPPAP